MPKMDLNDLFRRNPQIDRDALTGALEVYREVASLGLPKAGYQLGAPRSPHAPAPAAVANGQSAGTWCASGQQGQG